MSNFSPYAGSMKTVYTGTHYLLDNIHAVDHDRGVISVGAQGNVKNCAVFRVVDLLASIHREDLKGTEKQNLHKTIKQTRADTNSHKTIKQNKGKNKFKKRQAYIKKKKQKKNTHTHTP